MSDIFLSYAREDRERARRLVDALEARGWSVFWDRELIPGQKFREAIAEELAAAHCVVTLWSKISVHRDWVLDEAQTGKKRDVLVSVLLDDVSLPLGFGQEQAANLLGWQGDLSHTAFITLTEGVARFLARVQASSVQTPQAPAAKPAVRRTGAKAKASEPRHPNNTERAPGDEPANPPTPAPSTIKWFDRHPWFAPSLLLVVIFLANYAQTAVDAELTPSGVGAESAYPIAEAFRWLEGDLTFEGHEGTSALAYKGYSISYFFLFPAIAIGIAWTLWRRPDPAAYRAFGLAVALDYLVSLPFFILFPVPERWSFPESEAMLLSDKWNEALIEALRPISALDNCFPSFHVSLTALIVTACFLFKLQLRTFVLALGTSIVLATFVLGIHWIPDIIAGLAVGVASMLLAWRLTAAGKLAFLWRGTFA